MVNGKKYRFAYCVILLMITFFLPSCGNGAGKQPGINGYVYMPEMILDEYAGGSVKAQGDCLYYLRTVMEREKSRRQLVGCFPAEADNPDNSLVIIDTDQSIIGYAVDGEQTVYCLLADSKYVEGDSGYEFVRDDIILVQKLSDGTEGYRLHFEETGGIEISMAADDEGQAYLLFDQEIILVNKEGKIAGRVSVEEYRAKNSFGAWELLEASGKVYFYNNDSMTSLYEVVQEGNSLRLKAVEGMLWPDNSTVFSRAFGSPGGFLYNNRTDGILYQYSGEEASWHPLLRWSDSNLLSNGLQNVVWISDDAIAAVLNNEIIVLKRTPVEELPEKEYLVLASTGYLSYDLECYTAEFNQSNDSYHITIETYPQTEEGISRLDAAIVSSNPPDLLDLSGLDMQKYAAKGALENLFPYLDGSSSLPREAFLENVLDGYTFNGQLAGIPDTFTISILAGRASQLEEEGGWTMEAVMDFTDRYPEDQIFVFKGFEFVYDICAEYILEKYIDWEEGECDFDGEDFQKLAGWLSHHTKGIEPEYDRRYDTTEGVLLYKESVGSGTVFPVLDYIFGCKTAIMAYPLPDGREVYSAEAHDTLGILSRSHHKEGAWEFMEGFLNRERSEKYSYYYQGFPSRIVLLEEGISEIAEDGSKEIDLYLGGGTWKWKGLSLEQEKLLYHIIKAADFTPKGGLREEITGIVKEELAYFLTGSKPLEEVTAVLQNRIRNLVQENLE